MKCLHSGQMDPNSLALVGTLQVICYLKLPNSNGAWLSYIHLLLSLPCLSRPDEYLLVRPRLSRPPHMASLAPPASTTEPPLHSPNNQSEDLHSLETSLTDLQEKRLKALRLYQEEKTLRLAEAARAENLSAKLNHLSAQPDTQTSGYQHAPLNDHQHTTVPAHALLAELRSLGFLQGVPAASLTWHCLAMAEVLSKAKQVVAAQPASNIEEASVDSTLDRATGENGISAGYMEELTTLKSSLKLAEETAAAAKKAQQENEKLISQLKQQLDESTAACKDLIELVKEQEEIIEKLS